MIKAKNDIWQNLMNEIDFNDQWRRSNKIIMQELKASLSVGSFAGPSTCHSLWTFLSLMTLLPLPLRNVTDKKNINLKGESFRKGGENKKHILQKTEENGVINFFGLSRFLSSR